MPSYKRESRDQWAITTMAHPIILNREIINLMMPFLVVNTPMEPLLINRVYDSNNTGNQLCNLL